MSISTPPEDPIDQKIQEYVDEKVPDIGPLSGEYLPEAKAQVLGKWMYQRIDVTTQQSKSRGAGVKSGNYLMKPILDEHRLE
ncbi:hypothetical protein J6590_042251 [Homalodisca vitripennis]|nr:hypothetical protein J6590_042251 [Homalodisca vitripennis]